MSYLKDIILDRLYNEQEAEYAAKYIGKETAPEGYNEWLSEVYHKQSVEEKSNEVNKHFT